MKTRSWSGVVRVTGGTLSRTSFERDGQVSRVELQSKFILETADGEVHVEPRQEACWATDSESASKARALPNREKVVLERSEIREGARVVAVGRMKSERDVRVLAPTPSLRRIGTGVCLIDVDRHRRR